MFLNTDGGARGNPGPAAAGCVIADENNNIVECFGKYLGVATNNEAEYNAVIVGLERLVEMGVKEVMVRMDSELAVKQLNGLYKVKNDRLLGLYSKVKYLSERFNRIHFTHVRREYNKDADLIVNKTLDEQAQKQTS